jgi:hypothetical protein
MREALNQDREGLLSVTRLSLERARALRSDQVKLLHEEDMQIVVRTRSSRQDRVIKKHRNQKFLCDLICCESAARNQEILLCLTLRTRYYRQDVGQPARCQES